MGYRLHTPLICFLDGSRKWHFSSHASLVGEIIKISPVLFLQAKEIQLVPVLMKIISKCQLKKIFVQKVIYYPSAWPTDRASQRPMLILAHAYPKEVF